MSISTYLTFNGNCREAMLFYQQCLGGELTFETVGESPMAEQMPTHIKNYIIHSTLTNSGLLLMGSDMVSEAGLVKGNSVSMLLNCNSEADIRTLYERLSEGGRQTHPLERTYWGALFGDLTDRFGNQWLLSYQKNRHSINDLLWDGRGI